MKSIRVSAAIAALLLPMAAVQAEPIPKQLAGPPSEFAAMRIPDPAAAAIHSKSALLPVSFGAAKAGQARTTLTLPIEHGRARFVLFSATGGDGWQPTLVDPNGRRQSATSMAKALRSTDFGIAGERFPGRYFAFDQLAEGRWTLELDAQAGAPRDGFVLLEGDAGTELASYPTHRRQWVGETIGVAALLTSIDDADDTIRIGRHAGRIKDAELRVLAPDGTIASYPMFDDGRHQDGVAGDGVFGGLFKASLAGDYQAQVIAWGRNRDRTPIVRSAEHLIPIVERTLQLAEQARPSVSSDDGRYAIALPVASSKRETHRFYHVHAEVWGTGADGQPLPVAWIGGMSALHDGQLSLGLDPRWLAKAGANAPFELRAVRIEDPDHFVTVADAERLALPLSTPKRLAAPQPIAIDETMTMGPRPAESSAKATGSRLLLVHGYCSGGVWPTSQFSNASTFLDAYQNRSHDQFARLILDFGNQWNSYGIVAHSQGGAAALHLYTYYWSGLDHAGPGRLIQSVGTPYQGTNLSGILATLGSWFGVGCGNNDSMTYSGASAWLAGIPSWARAKVNYYTTSFKLTHWWVNDYCNFATDLVLSDPEDGTTEKAYGQLPGAVNQGHTSGQCHTSGMRDPAQYLDSNRNAVMNANAAR